MNVIKKDATVSSTGADEDYPGTFQVVLSAPTLDRDGDTLLPDEWKQPLPDKITFDTDHGMSVESTVGSGVPSLNAKGELVVNGTFASTPKAQETRTLVKEGHIDRTSVAFMTERSKDASGNILVKRELLNGAFVAIPSNREAVVLSSKSPQLKIGARNNASDADTIQAIHDATSSLGASCASDDAKTPRKRPQLKSVAGSLEATQDRANTALQDAFPGQWVWLQATIPDGEDGGMLVYQIENPDTYESESYQQSYTDDGNTIHLTGERAPVDLIQVIKPDPDDTDSTAATSAAAAKAATADRAAEDDKSKVKAQALALRIQAAAAMAEID